VNATPRPRPLAAALLLGCAALVGASAQAQAQAQAQVQVLDCETLRGRIAARLQAAGVLRYRLTIVDTAAAADGTVVGHCETGRKKIVYGKEAVTPTGGVHIGAPPAGDSTTAPARRPAPRVITECRDGSTPADGRCRR